MADVTPYSTIAPMLGVLPSWLTAEDAVRIEAYRLYEAMYWGQPETFKLAWRGTEDQPIYVPSAKTIVEACNRYLAVGFDYSMQSQPGGGSEQTKADARIALDTLFRREKFFAKFTTAKRFGLVRGDSLFHIRADSDKPRGRRISILEVDPASYFPITDPNDPDKVIGVHLVDQWTVDPLKPTEVRIRRQTYRKENGRVTSELSFWELGAWDDRPGSGHKLKRVTKDVPSVPKYELPPQITSIPVYHVMNQRTPLHPFGSSELRGLERIAAAINQGISDQEMALALAGLGQYVTNGGPPKDAEGNDTDWIMGPGSVVDLSGAKNEVFFDRVDGIGSVTPSIDHLNWLWRSMKEASATPDIATGAVDVSIAASGIALTLQMGPLLAKNAEKEDEILAVTDHMFFDLLNGWLPAYEQYIFEGVDAVPVVGDPMPVDRAAVIGEITALMATDPPILSPETARTILRDKLGYEFSETEATAIVDSAADLAAARDPFSQRLRENEIQEQGA